MALQTTGTIGHSEIMAEFGQTGAFDLSAHGAPLINKTAGTVINETDFYGAASGPDTVFDVAKNPPVYGAVSNGYGSGQTGSGTVDYNYAMTASTGSAGVTCGVCTVIPLQPNKSYKIDYDVTIKCTDKGTNFFLGDNTYGYTKGLSNTMVSNSYIQNKATFIQSGHWSNGGLYAWTQPNLGLVWYGGNSNGTFRISGTGLSYNVDQYGIKGVGLMLSQNGNANNNAERGSITIHSFSVYEAD